jgi:hypothetical protein
MADIPKSREGKKILATHVDPEVSLAFRKKALEQGTSVQALLESLVLDSLKEPSQDARADMLLVHDTFTEAIRMLATTQAAIGGKIK